MKGKDITAGLYALLFHIPRNFNASPDLLRFRSDPKPGLPSVHLRDSRFHVLLKTKITLGQSSLALPGN